MADKKTSLTKEESKIFNSLLPEKFHKEIWEEKDFTYRIRPKVEDFLIEFRKEISKLEESINNKDESIKEFMDSLIIEKCVKMRVFNCENKDAKLLGMVDIGLVKTFTSASSGNRLEGGAMQLIIEKAFEDSWKTNNAQMKGLNEVKLEFLKKCLIEYPECNSVINYEVDFRELGSSGNVFIYIKGTASVLGNKELDYLVQNEKSKIEEYKNDLTHKIPKTIELKKGKFENIRKNLYDIPSNFKGAIKYVERKMNS